MSSSCCGCGASVRMYSRSVSRSAGVRSGDSSTQPKPRSTSTMGQSARTRCFMLLYSLYADSLARLLARVLLQLAQVLLLLFVVRLAAPRGLRAPSAEHVGHSRRKLHAGRELEPGRELHTGRQ